MKIILSALLFSYLFTGCAEKEPVVVFQDKIVCFEQVKLDRPQEVKIRIHKDDLEVAKAYKQVINDSFTFYENQVDRNNKLCEDAEKKNKEVSNEKVK